jgi:hypothetical protein
MIAIAYGYALNLVLDAGNFHLDTWITARGKVTGAWVPPVSGAG